MVVYKQISSGATMWNQDGQASPTALARVCSEAGVKETDLKLEIEEKNEDLCSRLCRIMKTQDASNTYFEMLGGGAEDAGEARSDAPARRCKQAWESRALTCKA